MQVLFLKNERYTGDVMLPKTFVDDLLMGSQVKKRWQIRPVSGTGTSLADCERGDI